MWAVSRASHISLPYNERSDERRDERSDERRDERRGEMRGGMRGMMRRDEKRDEKRDERRDERRDEWRDEKSDERSDRGESSDNNGGCQGRYSETNKEGGGPHPLSYADQRHTLQSHPHLSVYAPKGSRLNRMVPENR